MRADRFKSLLTHGLAFDTETELSQPGISIPEMVCVSIAKLDATQGKVVGKLMDANTGLHVFLAALDSPDIVLVFANAVYDVLGFINEAAKRGRNIIPEIFKAYEDHRIYDILLAEALHHIGLGCLGRDPRTNRKFSDKGYNLEITYELNTGKTNAKVNDKWRKSYGLLKRYPIEQWAVLAGNEAVTYPVDDACNTFEAALCQSGLIPNVGTHQWVDGGNAHKCSRCSIVMSQGISPICTSTFVRMNLHDLAIQCRTHFAMALGGAWGLTPDPATVAELKYRVTKDLAVDILPFVATGILREDGTCNEAMLKRHVAEAYGATQECATCANTTVYKGRKGAKVAVKVPGKVIGPKGNPVVCPDCDGTGRFLTDAVPRSPSGEVGKGRDQLYESGGELLIAYAHLGQTKKIRTTYVPFFEEGIASELHLREDELTPQGIANCLERIKQANGRGVWPINLKPNVLLETNRTSYRDKTQTMPRAGGVRQCFKPREGFVYYSNDYGGIELATWAQICIWMLGRSDLAVALNNNINVHGALAAEMSGQSYEAFMAKIKAGDSEAIKMRQAAKPGNFMFPGGGGVPTFVQIQREQGPNTYHPSGTLVDSDGNRFYPGLRFCILIGGAQRCGEVMQHEWARKPIAPLCKKCLECAVWIHDGWEKKWSEAKPYFGKITQIKSQGFQKHPISDRIRGGIGFCDGANGYFQELAAQGAKDALWHVAREQYDHTYRPDDLGGQTSILLNNSRGAAFLHDELLGEARIDVAPECSERVGVTMVGRMKRYVPDVRVTAEPTLMPAWYKEAACVRDDSGRLMVWQPKRKK